jgi:predicted AAA+ superfamily ATPase
MTTYLPRVVDAELGALLDQVAAVAVDGPKAVGKTATASRYAATTVELDDPAQLAVAAADPALLLQRERPILLDEWQRLPVVWDTVRRAVDRDSTPNQFLLTGSASPGEHDTHSGAGRIIRLRMRPLALAERGVEQPTVSLRSLLMGKRRPIEGATDFSLADYTHEILASGFPGFRHLQGRALRAQLDGYIARIVDRDFEEQGHRVRRPETLRRWLAAYAAASSTAASLETVRDAATGGEGEKPARTSTIVYREVLERLWIIDPVPPWLPSRNDLKTLAQAPKHQIADPALAARLLGVDADALLRGGHGSGPASFPPPDGSLLGQLFESLVTLSVRVFAQAAEALVQHLRTHGGRHEVDLIVARSDRRVLAMEVKLSATITDDDVKHLHWLQEQIGDDLLDAIIVTTGPRAYRRKDGIGVVPLALLGP